MTLDEALAIASEEAQKVPEPINDVLTIDPESRTISVPSSELIFGVESDDRAERKYFKCPKVVGNSIDLTEHEIYVVYQNANTRFKEKDKYHVIDVETTEDDYITFSWELSAKVTAYVGDITFIVCATKTDPDGTIQNKWNTTTATGKCLTGLTADMSSTEQQSASDIYTQLINELNGSADSKKSEINSLTTEKKTLLENTGTNQKKILESTGTAQQTAIEDKGAATLESIPEDYTELNDTVENIGTALAAVAPGIVESAAGSEITVTDSSEMPLQGMNIYGRSKQFTTTGSNLFKITKTSETLKGITFDVRKDGTIKISGTNTESSALYVILGTFEVVAGQTYIFNNFYSLENSDVETYVQIDSNIALAKINAKEKDRYMYTAKETGVLKVSFKVRAGVTIDTTLSEMQINVGETALPYEPYTGGKPSPSPEYPQEIESVGRVLSTGKNLFDFSKLNSDYGLNTNDKTIVIPAKTNNVGYYNSLKELCPSIQAGNTYVLNAKTSNPEGLRTIHLVNTNVDINFGKAFIPTEEQINDKISFYNNVNTEKENVISEIQLELGSVATSYEPYTGGVPALYQKDIEVGVTGKNLFGGKAFADKIVELGGSLDETNKTVTINAGLIDNKIIYEFPDKTKQYTIMLSGYNTQETQSPNISIMYSDGTKSVITNLKKNKLIVITRKDKEAVSLSGTWVTGVSIFYYEQCGIFEGVLTETDFKPYKYQSLPITTPTGLPAIPVPSSTSGITYTDADGQAWIADEIDFARGKYIQRVWQAEFDGSEDEEYDIYGTPDNYYGFYLKGEMLPNVMNLRMGFSNEYIILQKREIKDNSIYLGINNKGIYFIKNKFRDDSLEDKGISNLKAHLAEHPLKVMTYLNTPIETDLSEEQLQAYKAVRTNKPTTIISNDADAYMSLDYTADTKLYIDNKIKEVLQNG